MKPTPRLSRSTKQIPWDDDDADNFSMESEDSSVAIVKRASNRGRGSNINRKNQIIQKRRTNKERKLRQQRVFNGGKWSKKERLDFLLGLRKFGPGKWKKIQTILTTRSNIQIKSHGQKILKRLEDGEDIYFELKQAEQAGECPSSPRPVVPRFNIVSASSSVASSKSSSSSSDDDDDDDDDTDSVASEISWTDSRAAEDVEHQDTFKWHQHQSFDTMVYPVKSTNGKNGNHDQAVLNGSKKSTSASPLNFDEATVVLALFELADPLKLRARIAASTAVKEDGQPQQITQATSF